MPQPPDSSPDTPNSSNTSDVSPGEDRRRRRLIDGARRKAGHPADETVTHHAGHSDTGGGSLDVRCPHCHAAMPVAVDTQLTAIACQACGNQFSLVNRNKETWTGECLSTLGRFELVERIGMGGFGSVWKARDRELDRVVALKIPRNSDMTVERQESFFREARAAAQLRHPNIVTVHEVGRDGDSIFIVSDFVRGKTLGDWLANQHLSNRDAAKLCAIIADALEHAHERGIVHRDLKPGNVMIDGEGQPHLMDFGLARREIGEVTITTDGQILGTPAYMSPEQAAGEAHSADRRSDVYSLGVVLYQLLTNEIPFRGNARMLLQQVIEEEPPSPRKFNAQVARDLETITLKCLEKAPSARYQSALELANELRRFLRGEPIHARPISSVERSLRWCRRRPAVAALLAIAALSLVALGIWGTRELRAARELRLQMSDNLLKSAEVHSRVGEWREALDKLDQASALGARDSVGVRVSRLQALQAIASPRAKSELESLVASHDLGHYEAKVCLQQGLMLLVREGLDAAQPYFDRANSAGGLAPSDKALIEGLTAQNSTEALARFQSAVELEPFGQEARRFLILMLASCGKLDEASKQAEVGEQFFPQDPNFPLLHAYVAASAGRVAEISKRLEARVLRQLDPQVIEQYSVALRNLAALHQESAKLWDFARMASLNDSTASDVQSQEALFGATFEKELKTLNSQRPEELVRQFQLVSAITSFGSEKDRPQSLAEIARRALRCGPYCLVKAYEPIRDLFSLRTQGFLREGKGNVERIDFLIDRLQESSRAHPDSFFAYARGLMLFVRGRLEEAASAFEEASAQYSAFGGFSREAAFAAARCGLINHRRGVDGALERAVQQVRVRLDRGPISADHAAAMFEVAMAGEDYDSARRLLMVGRKKGEATPELLIAQADVEIAAKNYLEAMRLAEQIPSSSPIHTRAQQVIVDCRAKLAEIVDRPAKSRPSDAK